MTLSRDPLCFSRSSSQKPAFFFLTLQSRSMIHRHTEIWKRQGSASASPLIQKICSYLSKWAYSFVRASVACAILEEPLIWSHHLKTTALRYLKLVIEPNCHFTFISLWMPLARFVISLVFSALISILYLVQVLSRLSTRASSSCSSSARASMSSANRRLEIFLPLMLNLPIMFFQGIKHDPFKKC